MKKYLFISFLVILGLYLFFISPKENDYTSLNNQYAITLHEIERSKRNLLHYDKIVEDWRLKKPQYESANKILPDEDNHSLLFDQIRLIASEHNINIEINDSYHHPVNKDFYSVRYFGIKVSGQRVDLQAFLDSLSKGKTLFEVIDLSMFSPREGTSIYTTELLGKSYFYIQGNKSTHKYHRTNIKVISDLSHWFFPVFVSVTCFWLSIMMVLYLIGTRVTSLFFKAPANRNRPESVIASLSGISLSKRIILISVSCILSALFTVAFIPEFIITKGYLEGLLKGNSFLYTKIDLYKYLDISLIGSIFGAVYFPIVFLMSTALIIVILKRLHPKPPREIHLFYFFFFLSFFIPLFLSSGSLRVDYSREVMNHIYIYIIVGVILILFSVIPLLAARLTVFMLKGSVNREIFLFRKKYPLLIILTSAGLITAALTGNWLMNASDFVNRGHASYETGAYQTAISDFTKAIELDDTKFTAYKFRALSYYELNHYSKAISDFKTTLKINPDYIEAHILSAIASELNADIHGAIMNLSTGLYVAPDYRYAHYFRGTLYDSFGLYASAITDLSNAIFLEPENSNSITERANIYFKTGLFKKAHADFQDLVRLMPADSTAHLFRFIAARRANRDETIALQRYFKTIKEDIWVSVVIKMLLNKITPEQMLKIVMENSSSTDNLSQCYFYAGQYYVLRDNREKAIKMFEAALQTNKNYDTIYNISKHELTRFGL